VTGKKIGVGIHWDYAELKPRQSYMKASERATGVFRNRQADNLYKRDTFWGQHKKETVGGKLYINKKLGCHRGLTGFLKAEACSRELKKGYTPGKSAGKTI